MTNVRRKTAEVMSTSWNSIPHVTQFDQADITELEGWRSRVRKRAEASGAKVTVTAIALRVAASALKVFPKFNASLDIERNEIIYKKYVHIGVAVDTPRGLLVPVAGGDIKTSRQTDGSTPGPSRDIAGALRSRRDVATRDLSAAIRLGLEYLESQKGERGSWEGDYGGPMFLLPMYVGTAYATGIAIDPETRTQMERYLRGHQNPDGGWGLHVEASSAVFTTVLSYVALRLLGMSAADPDLVRARRWFRAQGGPLVSASWGKFFLAILGIYEYRGLHPVPPELWLLPESWAIHPSQMWCHARMVYLPMSWLYATRAQVPDAAGLKELREELHDQRHDPNSEPGGPLLFPEIGPPTAPNFKGLVKRVINGLAPALVRSVPSPALRTVFQTGLKIMTSEVLK